MHIAALVTALLASALVACGEARPTVVVPLEVSAAGTYAVNGTVVSLDTLKDRLRAIQSSGSTPNLQISASPGAAFDAVGRVVKAASDVGATVAFVTSTAKP